MRREAARALVHRPRRGRGWSRRPACRTTGDDDAPAGRRLAQVRPDRILAANGSNIVSFEDHIQFYSADESSARADFLTASDATRPTFEVASVPSNRGLVAELVARIARAGSRAVAVDVTAPDVREAGLSVVKTVAPGLCALDVAHRARFLGGPRLRDASKKAMLTERSFDLDDLNPDPHPFP